MKYIQMIIVVIVLSIFVPRVLDAGKKSDNVNLSYSETFDKFIVMFKGVDNKTLQYQVEFESNITLDEYMENLPFKTYNYLLSKNKFPAKFSQWADSELIRKNSQTINIKPDSNYNQKQIPLYTIFESKPKYLRLGYSKFGITSDKNGINVIDMNINKIDDNRSQNFTGILKNLEFKFPIKNYFTNPSTKKPFDEGAFIQDDKDEIYHVKLVNDEIVAKKTMIKQKVDFMSVNENTRREFYGVLISGGVVSLVIYDNYKLVNLPSQHYDPTTDKFSLTITPVSKYLVIEKDSGSYAYKFDENYKIEREFYYPIKEKEYILKEWIVPFELSLKPSYRYEFEIKFHQKAFILNVLLAILTLLLYRRNNNGLAKVGISLVFGIYGFVTLILI